MKGKYYLTDYLLQEKIIIEKYNINLINAPAGSGKTSFIFADNGLIYDTTKFINYKLYESSNYNFSFNLDKIIYICDTTMLKDKILSKYQSKTKSFDDKSFQEAKDEDVLKKLTENLGKIKVLTYAQFGKIMSKGYLRNAIYKYFDLIIMDEFHNLFDYAQAFDKKDKIYANVIENLENLATNSLLVSLTATPYYANKEIKESDGCIKNLYNIVLNEKQIEELRQYEEEYITKQLYLINEVKWLCLNKNKVDEGVEIFGSKILIYATQIKTCNKYKEMLTNAGYKVENLCTEKKMNEEQILLKKYLIEHEKYPDDLDILIINKAYDTGWDLKDERVKTIIIDSTNPTIQTQVRNRCRHDIYKLVTKMHTHIENNGEFYDAYSTWLTSENKRLYTYDEKYILNFTLDEKYLSVELSNEMKYELVKKYATYGFNGTCNWKSFKYDLESNDYVAKTTAHGTIIYNKDDINIVNNEVVDVRRMKNEEKTIDWLKNKWDRERIPCIEVRDTLDFGRKTWENIIASEKFNDFLKENSITIKSIKGMGKTLYFKTY